ncbi:hypothetical protein [Haloparvum sedimenti]|uniref:hypothetical protein n=1 Tax=Haloparvum sedimenti TaxID=1678448 RepID=UPI000F79A270|nr:hypothetical protein [Haloparvum sedimenti]
MSNTSLRTAARSPVRASAALSNKFRRLTAVGVRALAFWAAVLLPLTYLPVLHGMVVDASAGLFLVLLATNVACAVVGHDYRPGHGDASTDRTTDA